MMNPFHFIRQIREEMNLVTWPGLSETLVNAVVVVIFVIIAAIFLAFADFLSQTFIGWLLDRSGA